MIELKITIPNEEINDGVAALAKRMSVLGYQTKMGVVWMQVEGPDVAKAASKPEGVELSQDALTPNSIPPATDAKVEPKKTRAKKTEPAPNISTQPEARVEPEVEAQDEADEAAEVAASAPASEVVTAEMLRAEMGAYAQKFGMDAALADGSKVFTDALGQAPEGGWKLSVVAGIGGETLAKAVAAWRSAAAGSARYGEGK